MSEDMMPMSTQEGRAQASSQRGYSFGISSTGLSRPVAPAPIRPPLSSAVPTASSAPLAPLKNNRILTVLFVTALAIMAAALIFPGSYDNDVWFFLATGKEIVQHGIPYENPFAIHEGMGIVVQQWLLCVIIYGIYEATGFVGLGFYVLVLFALFILSLYCLGRLLRRASGGSEVITLLMAVAVAATYPFMTVRPHLYSMIAFVWIVFFLERYRSASDMRWLIPLPFIVILHVNIQAAMAPYDLAIVFCYAIPDVVRLFHRRQRLLEAHLWRADYRRAPLWGILVLCALALLVNPYTLDGALYLIHSLGSASQRQYIAEMKPFAPAMHPYGIVALLFMFAAVGAIGVKGIKRIDMPLVLLLVINIILAFAYLRNLWLAVLFGAIYLFSATSTAHIRFLATVKGNAVFSAVLGVIGTGICVVSIALAIPSLADKPANTANTPVAAMDYVEESGVPADNVRVFTFFNAGGYIEYRGYRVNIDPRPELWSPAITGHDKDYYLEYLDMAYGDMFFDEYISLNDLNVFIIPDEENLAAMFRNDWTFAEIPSGDGYTAFVKRDVFMKEA